MKTILCLLFTCLVLLGIPMQLLAQEIEESAEVSLETYSDEFQERFFEALKQKGIENYDKAINLLLECKRIQAANVVVDHELAKAYLADKQYLLAQDHAILAINEEPNNLWYLNTLVDIIQQQGNTLESLKEQLPSKNNEFQENLALIHYRNGNYKAALNVLNGIKKTSFSNELALKIQDSIDQKEKSAREPALSTKVNIEESPLTGYKSKIMELINSEDYKTLEIISAEALESFPSQPYFYYAQGLALNKNGKHTLAEGALLSGLDYLLDEPELANNIYRELSVTYTALGNTSKANMYLRKIKPGS
ncbi:tetratricopeptide repeat protein [Spongiimicrobium sp. 3-5]|uniref:tetratricopeptide repeat protein n=1 Tax=Spongiimicrobium sp. 3-5 TaxID=3332596 RepID=UPI0039806145